MQRPTYLSRQFALWLCLLFILQPAFAQYFGRNKPHYRNFDFEVLESPHFDLYYYFSDSLADQMIRRVETWYQMHQDVFRDTFYKRNPIILYANHPDFQQTTAISGLIGEGTGGVTEGLKNRVVLPVTPSNQQTRHVIGHELVHAFQYHLLLHQDSVALENVPLWLIEGMAEYLSLGRQDAHTAMWMRDAVQQQDIPSIRDLTYNSSYFPYRYGEAFWAFLTGSYGDHTVRIFLEFTARRGLDRAILTLFGVNEKALSQVWKNTLNEYYQPWLSTKDTVPPGIRLIDERQGSKTNISPTLSPDGKYLMFISGKNVFSYDLFLADAQTGRIIRQVASTVRDPHLDALSFLESTGSWSPDGRYFAFVGQDMGKHQVVIKEVLTGKTTDAFFLDGLPAFSNLSWSPDGKRILLTGLSNGQSDLYVVDLPTREIRQLTNDPYSDLQATWAPDGKTIAFTTDRLSYGHSGPWWHNLALIDVASGQITNLDIFPGADNVNPVFSPDGRSLYFLSNRDGFRNLYNFDLVSGRINQLTDLFTGISGITPLSPAFSVSSQSGAIAYTYYSDQSYTICKAGAEDFKRLPVQKDEVDFRAATLPPGYTLAGKDIVSSNLAQFDEHISDTVAVKKVKYRPKFRLDYLGGNTGVGVSFGGFSTSTGLAGGVDMLFGDMLSIRQLYTGLVLNGEIQDIGGQAVFINQKNRWAWGGGISHIPYRSAALGYAGVDTLILSDDLAVLADHWLLDIYRTYENKAEAFTFYPISENRRIEFDASFAHYGFSLHRTHAYFSGGSEILETRERLPAPDGFFSTQFTGAYVKDKSFFGLASPYQGERYRLSLSQYLGEWNIQALTFDYRHYWYLKPFSVAVRALHYGRYGKDIADLPQLFIGYPWLVRGYRLSAFDLNATADQLTLDQLLGQKMFIGNAEIRLPMSGPEVLKPLVKSRIFFTELAWFFDGGYAWDNLDNSRDGTRYQTQAIFSTGASFRINLFGALVLEPFYAFPLTGDFPAYWGINFVPGW